MRLSSLKASINRSVSIMQYDHGKEIKGITMQVGIPLSRPVKLYERSTGLLVSVAISTSDGKYRFRGLPALVKFTVVAIDPANQFNAVIQDNVVPK